MLFCWISLYNKKQPFFGNKSFKPKGPTIKTYPLFSKEFKNRPKAPRKKHIHLIIVICILVLIALFLLYLLGLANREIITESYTIEKYNSFNQLTDEKRIEEADKVLICVDKNSHRGRVRYSLKIEFAYSDGSYIFRLDLFNGSDGEKLNEMLIIKEKLPKEKIEIDAKYYQKAIDYYGFNENEIALFKQLIN